MFEVLFDDILFQYSFDSFVSVWYLMLLNVFLWFAYLSLKKTFVFEFTSFGLILVFYKTLLVRHFSLSGHSLVFSYAIACSCNIVFLRIDYLFVMRINYVFHVGHAAVAYFHVDFIEQLVKFVVSRKVLISSF